MYGLLEESLGRFLLSDIGSTGTGTYAGGCSYVWYVSFNSIFWYVEITYRNIYDWNDMMSEIGFRITHWGKKSKVGRIIGKTSCLWVDSLFKLGDSHMRFHYFYLSSFVYIWNFPLKLVGAKGMPLHTKSYERNISFLKMFMSQVSSIIWREG